MRVVLDESSTKYRPGLNWNEHTETVLGLADELREAIRRCQAADHDPDYGNNKER